MNFFKLLNRFFVMLVIMLFASCKNMAYIPLFDGKSFDGWEGPKVAFRIDNGAIVGGNLTNPLTKSYYLSSTEKYTDFDLTLLVKFDDKEKIGNGGVSFRAHRVPGTDEVAGYQADLGFISPKVITVFSDHTPKDMNNPFALWGSLVDECRSDVSRYPKPKVFPVIFLGIPERDRINKILKPDDWNKVQILARGKNIEIKINGKTTVKYTEKSNVPADGYICLQAHKGKSYEVMYKDIKIRPLK